SFTLSLLTVIAGNLMIVAQGCDALLSPPIATTGLETVFVQEGGNHFIAQFDYLLKGLLVCGCCQLRMHGHAGIPATRIRRYLCSHKESQHAGSKCPNRTVQAEMIEELVWQSVSELLRNPQVLIEQYNQRKESDYGAPEQQEQQRLKRRMAG